MEQSSDRERLAENPLGRLSQSKIGNSNAAVLVKRTETGSTMKLRKWTVFVALALALLTACGDDSPGGNSGTDSGNTETDSGYN